MPPVFGPGVAVADPLEVLRRRHRHDASRRRRARAARAPRPRGTPRRPRGAPASPKRSLEEEVAQRRACLARAAGDHHALAGGEPVRLQHGGIGRAVHLRLGLLVGRRTRRARRSGRRPRASAPSRTPCCPRAARPPRAARTPAGPRPRARRRAPRPAAPRARRRSDRRARPRRGARGRRRPRRRRRSSARPAAMPALPGAHSTSGRARAAAQRAHDRVLAAAAADDEDRSLRSGLVRDVAGDHGAEHHERERVPLRATSPRSTP